MKPNPVVKQTVPTKTQPGSEPEKTARGRAAALAGIDPPSAGEISKSAWDEFNRELDAFGNRLPPPVPDPSIAATKTIRKSKA